MHRPRESPSQTAGPYVHVGCIPDATGFAAPANFKRLGQDMLADSEVGERIRLEIDILDGAGEPVEDALVEIWQPGPEGGFGETRDFCNWGRQAVGSGTGRAIFHTLKPGSRGDAAPHVLVWIAARGINLALATRIYFPDEENGSDPVFRLAAGVHPP